MIFIVLKSISVILQALYIVIFIDYFELQLIMKYNIRYKKIGVLCLFHDY